jgi:predicted DsbA family dithiol-disulfide isomerase
VASRLAIPVYYDFASTICFVAHRVLERMVGDLEALGIVLEWQPIDLSRITRWPRGTVVEGERRQNALRVARELDVPVQMPARWLDSTPAHRVALALAGTPKEPAWRERVWSAVFEEGRDVGAEGELERLGVDLGIDAVSLAGEHSATALVTATDMAAERGVSGVPTFDVGFPLGGIHDPATMRMLFERRVAKLTDRLRDS